MNRDLFRDAGSLNRAVVDYDFSFDGVTSNPVTNLVGKGYTVSRTATGTFVITILDPVPTVLSGHADLQLATGPASAPFATPGPMTSPKVPNWTFTVYTWNAGGTALTDPPAGSRLNIGLVLQNTDRP